MTRTHPSVAGKLLQLLYGVYAWTVFLFCVLLAIFFALIVPGLQTRRRWVAAAGRAFFLLAGIRVDTRGLQNLPEDNCIVVANHASYLDGVILQTFLPPRFGYVIKSEVRKVPILHFALRRVGSRFVERYATAGSARDARALVRAAAAGESLAFFPEGTFQRPPGLGRFRPGAFAAAINAGLPVVPVVIRGSRDILPAGALLPMHAALTIEIRPALPTAGGRYNSSTSLVEAARQSILEVLQEPDLLADQAA